MTAALESTEASFVRPHLLFGFPGGGGGVQTIAGSRGGPGGGGAGSGANESVSNIGADGGLMGGGGGSGGSATSGGLGGLLLNVSSNQSDLTRPIRLGGGMGGFSTRAGAGGGGYARGVFSVDAGQSFVVTVAETNATASGGLVLVEW